MHTKHTDTFSVCAQLVESGETGLPTVKLSILDFVQMEHVAVLFQVRVCVCFLSSCLSWSFLFYLVQCVPAFALCMFDCGPFVLDLVDFSSSVILLRWSVVIMLPWPFDL